MMFSIEPSKLPDQSLLNKYSRNGHYTDCYRTELNKAVTHSQFVNAFYTTLVFKLERWILKWAVSKPSTNSEAVQLAEGAIDNFAAWQVEDRNKNQLLLTDFQNRTRSWLMTVSVNGENNTSTQLYFGSAIIAVKNPKTGEATMGFVFRALLGFHKLYSIVLLFSARVRLRRQLKRQLLRPL